MNLGNLQSNKKEITDKSAFYKMQLGYQAIVSFLEQRKKTPCQGLNLY